LQFRGFILLIKKTNTKPRDSNKPHDEAVHDSYSVHVLYPDNDHIHWYRVCVVSSPWVSKYVYVRKGVHSR